MRERETERRGGGGERGGWGARERDHVMFNQSVDNYRVRHIRSAYVVKHLSRVREIRCLYVCTHKHGRGVPAPGGLTTCTCRRIRRGLVP